MGHPIIAMWVLATVAFLLSLDSGFNVKKASESSGSDEQVEMLEIDPSTINPIKIVIGEDNFTNQPEVEEPTKKTEVQVEASTTGGAENKESIEEAPKAVTPVSTELDKDAINGSSNKPTDLGQSSTEELLQMAREAYWNNGLDEAAQIYKQLIELEPDVVEHKGELGNVYWRQGYPKKAAELYSEIAIPMIDKGSSERVTNMVGFIELFYPKKATEINKRIQLKKSQE